MKQKITLLILAICMATVARPQTLISQKTEKVFGFKNKMVVLKTRIIKTFEYQRSMPDSGYELIGAGDADLLPLRDVRVYEKIDASFPIKNMGLMNHYDTSDYAKAFANPGEVVFTNMSDTINILKNVFFSKDTKIKKYGISFGEGKFVLDIDESTKTESTAIEILLVILMPFVGLVMLNVAILLPGVFSRDGESLAGFYKKIDDMKDSRYIMAVVLSSAITCILGGFLFLSYFDNSRLYSTELVVNVPIWTRVIMFIARLVFTFCAGLIFYRFIKRLGLKIVNRHIVQAT